MQQPGVRFQLSGARLEHSHEGLDFPSTAQVEATRALAEHAVSVVPGSERHTLSVEVRDDHGAVFATRIVFEMVKMRGEPDQYGRDQSEAKH